MDAVALARFHAGRDLSNKAVRSICYAPHTNLFFDIEGRVRVCCWNWKHELGNAKTDTLDDMWAGAKARILRRGLEQDDLRFGCDFCHEQTKDGWTTRAAMRNFDQFEVLAPDPEWPQRMEFSISNSCNLECVMCNGLYSSAIRAHREKLPPRPTVYSAEFIKSLRKYLPHLVRAKFLGGEPFLITEYHQIWQMMVEDAPHVSCHITTNGTQYNRRVEEFMEKLNFGFSVSLDGATKETVERIRVNANFAEQMAILKRFRDYTRERRTDLSLTFCFMRQNWHEFGDFCLFADDWGCRVGINTVNNPPQFSVNNLPPDGLRAIVTAMEREAVGLERALTLNRDVWFSELERLQRKLAAAPTRAGGKQTSVSRELALRQDHLCAVPFTGMTINPLGQITLCCMTPGHVVGSLNEIPDLTKFYNSAVMEPYRSEMEEGRINSLVPCSNFCWKKYSQGQHSFMTIANQSPHFAKAFDADWQLRKANRPRPVRFLEYTCSNICNQTCATCSSFFSSKWRDIEQQFSSEEMKRFDRHIVDTQSLSDEDIEKIMEILPGLSQLVVKGGEPFADKNNIRVLDALLDVNPQCAVSIVSNMQSISESTFKVLEKIKTNRVENFKLAASIDGIGKVYEWIRSTPFGKTIRNLERFYEITGRKTDISACISILNYFHLEAIVEYFVDKKYVAGVAFNNVAVSPKYIAVHNLPHGLYDRHKAVLERCLPLYKEKLESNGKWFAFNPVLHDVQLNKPFSVSGFQLSVQWVEKMNEIRGFRLQDHIPELNDLAGVVTTAAAPPAAAILGCGK